MQINKSPGRSQKRDLKRVVPKKAREERVKKRHLGGVLNAARL